MFSLDGAILPFAFGVVYSALLTITATINGVPATFTSRTHKARGQVFGYIFEDFLLDHYPGSFLSVQNSNKGYDLVTRSGDMRIECKTVTSRGVKFCPSGDYGKGRSFDSEAFARDTPAKIFAVGTLGGTARNIVRWTFVPGYRVVAWGPSLTYKAAMAQLFSESIG